MGDKTNDIEPTKVTKHEAKKSVLQEEVLELTGTLADLKACRRATPRYVQFADLPEEDRFKMLSMKGKYFIDTIKLIAYRAETAMEYGRPCAARTTPEACSAAFMRQRQISCVITTKINSPFACTNRLIIAAVQQFCIS